MAVKIPRTLSTQHPDNVTIPFFANHSVLRGDDEIKEAFYAFSNLGVEEIMWDAEGKEADDFVIRKLITDYKSFFKTRRIGKDIFINIRIPNPDYEKAEAKILLETLESIPRSYDTASLFYGDGKYPPIFDVVVPMADEKIIRKIYDYYKNVVIGKEKMKFVDHSPLTVGDWIGEFNPKRINVIPLFEDIDSILTADKTLRTFLKGKDVSYQRVFLARSDPAMNYSSVAVILALHIALERLYDLQKEVGIPIHPILGSGSAPFRGHLTPRNADYILSKYPSVSTFTIQSAFKYDFPVQEVQRAIDLINKTPVKPPIGVEDPERALKILRKVSREYQRQIQILAPLINEVAKFVPSRRMRKLHTGLFGYSRELKKGVTLPRVISFCAVLYSLGLPPDLLGLNVLTKEEFRIIRGIYSRFEEGLRDSLELWNEDVLKLVPSSIRNDIKSVVQKYSFQPQPEHREISSEIIESLKTRRFSAHLTDLITRAGAVRGFLG
ncbi:MAG: phosphoenolpyruvate carboxylase [Candidatus Omnitrophota bacterium]|nr:phosphoenolpyruvate carboxylase [Candidatus Omnitrophota bacterium]MDZ4241946.1 phosphoenolpyruvate carboxylase [Candidatus Omnitrophota bacterium]